MRKGGLPPDLAQLAARFAQWRRAHDLGTRIPDALWDAAVDVAQRHGVSRTAQTLKLGYDALKKRIEKKGPLLAGRHAGRQPAFLELTPGPVVVPSECTIEFEKPGGARMRVQLKGSDLPDLAALGRTFWEGP